MGHGETQSVTLVQMTLMEAAVPAPPSTLTQVNACLRSAVLPCLSPSFPGTKQRQNRTAIEAAGSPHSGVSTSAESRELHKPACVSRGAIGFNGGNARMPSPSASSQPRWERQEDDAFTLTVGL